MELMNSTKHLLPAIAIGDAMGLPFEAVSAEEMAKHQKVKTIIEPSSNEMFADSPLGTYSDDTQQALAVAESIVELEDFDLHDLAQRLVEQYEISSAGWGRGSVSAMENLKAGTDPEYSGSLNSRGCGALMRLAPLVFWQYSTDLEYEDKNNQVMLLTSITHPSVQTQSTALLHAGVLEKLLEHKNGNIEPAEVIKAGINRMGRSRELRPIFERLNNLMTLGKSYEVTPDRLKDLLENPEKPFSHVDVLLTAYASFFYHGKGNTLSMISDAISYGGDTDSTAAIVGAMSIAKSGDMELDFPELNLIDNAERIKRVSKQLGSLMLKNHNQQVT